ncbi:aminotransferase class I/II-fold pyridoxal phosphate-dependent enzyme [Candidatus Venteria ishoeyi]|uniref:Putative aminotransferase/MSMEI_6121 n=1 Tax=Candidatus Venteria ishoeyi TaxID=1899563 RepID=A0A1H6FAM5_9GAMM|nr:aminotransferase class I/II-fold pyridoxal phosphate-dependent enzyme [Candidatus Venteria ishoeyi]SEH07160.1 Putative aminotransferase/MSMEI_6121 [Candidatus Venteria ishoeyi]
MAHLSIEQLSEQERQLSARYQGFLQAGLNLDLTRGKPSTEQLALSDALDGILAGNYKTRDGVDVRNYGGINGIPEARELGAALLGISPEQTLVGGNSSLTLMYQYMMFCMYIGIQGENSAWFIEAAGKPVKFLCVVPGYDRHFTICESLNIEMINIDMTASGPDMAQVEALVKADSNIKGIWCVPKYSNPSGECYSKATVQRLAQLGNIAGKNFRIMWDNAYAVHDLDTVLDLANIMDACQQAGTTDSVFITGSTSKITFAGAGVSFAGSSVDNLKHFKNWLSAQTIGPDKVNQLRHVRFLKNHAGLLAHMEKHALILKPKFDRVQEHLTAALEGQGVGNWTIPQGGYFVSFNTLPGLAKEVVRLTGEAGVKLTPAGATFPYQTDPQDCNIRIAPSFPSLEEIDQAMPVFITCVQLASVRQQIAQNS